MINNLKPYIIAITGSFGVGKNLVGDILNQCGVYVIDTDDIVNDLLKSKNQITLKIVKEFGHSVINKSEEYFIDKKALSDIVFSNKNKKNKLEEIIHPEVRNILADLISSKNTNKIIAILIPLLFEGKLEHICSESWCVVCNENIQLERLKGRGLSLEEAKARISSQLSQSKKAKRSGFIINNSGSKEKTKEQVLIRLKELAQLDQNLHAFFYK